MADHLVHLAGVGKGVPGNDQLLHDIDLTVESATSTAIVGRSGSGKSTLLSLLALLDTADRGRFSFDGQDVAQMALRERERLRGRQITLVFQRFALLAHLSALENTMVPLRHSGGSTSSKMRRTAMEVLDSVGMAGHARRHPRALSGGEQQRVAIARALVTRPALILADEPTGALDQETGDSVMALLSAHTRERGAALIVVTHDLSVASRFDRVMRIASGTLRPDAQD